jgi:FtsH-binding integral membrane protein
MKKHMTQILMVLAVILMTATFTFAEAAMTTAESFPYFHLGCLIIGGLTFISLQTKYEKMRLSESVGSFALYTALIALFTEPVVNVIKTLIG